MDFGWNLHYSSKERSKAMYKAILRRLLFRKEKLHIKHLELTLACAIEWGIDYEELMAFLQQINLFDNKEQHEQTSDFI